jgi:voltage-gated potassium channel
MVDTYRRLKIRTYEILEKAEPDDTVSRAVDGLIIALILLNLTAIILETVGELHLRYGDWFEAFELFSVALFTVEYLFRLWSCTAAPDYTGPIAGRWRFARTPMAIIDLLAFLPFYLTLGGLDLRFLRILRIFRIFRVAKLFRYLEALQTLGRVLRAKKEELVVVLLILVVLLLFSSTLIYYAEHEAQPELFSSIPAAMWWGIATLTTVGYGDIYPVTPLGRLLAAFITVLGIGMFALPTGIVGSGFVEEIQKRKGGKRTCPHCGKDSEEDGGRGSP